MSTDLDELGESVPAPAPSAESSPEAPSAPDVAPSSPPPSPSTPSLGSRALKALGAWINAPQASVRLELVRIGAPLWILGFMSGRLQYADEWISSAGFRVSDLGGPWWDGPIFVPGIPPPAAWAVAAILVVSALVVSAGYKTRISASVLFVTLVFVALADQISSFTVTKIGPVITLALVVSPAGKRLSVDAWLKRRAGGKRTKAVRPIGAMRFYQVFLPVFYSAAGIAKAKGDWLTVPNVLFSHLHNDYQTAATVIIGNITPPWVWTPLQALVLLFEIFAPLWFALRWTRPYALVYAVAMHVVIAVMFGQVVWFSLLMITVVLAAFLPDRALSPLERAAAYLESRPRHPREANP